MKPNYKNREKKGFSFFLEKIFFVQKFFQELPSQWIGLISLFFLVGLLYVSNSHLYTKSTKELHKIEEEWESLKSDLLLLQSEYMEFLKKSNIEKKVDQLGLKTPKKPPYIIKRK